MQCFFYYQRVKEAFVAQFVTVKQAVTILNISRPTIQRKLKEGEIPHVRFGKRILIPNEFFKQLSDRAMEQRSKAEG